jgi:maltose alpha-D-glucosyltransferase/alpha-amylase
MAFHFPLMPRKFMAIRMEDRFPIIEVLQQTPKIPETCQWALFLRNHDELTLEMVTDEERDYMYRVYAHDPQMRVNLGIRRRLAPLLRNNRRQIELMNSLLFSLPGTPVIYYGDEIGMGDNIYLGDRNGVRSPMQWSADRNAGFSRANPQKLFLPVIIDPENHYEAVNVEVQQNNPHSLLWWMKRLISLTKRTKVFGRGTLEFLYPENRKVLAFIRKYHDECMLVVANLSRFAQSVELDLSAFKGVEPEEMFGKSRFPAIAERPYLLTLGPQGYYFFSLTPRPAEAGAPAAEPPLMKVQASWENALEGRGKVALEALLPGFLKGCRWFSGKGRTVQSVGIWEAIPLPQDSPEASLLLVQVDYTEGDPENYVLPLAFSSGEAAAHLQGTAPQAVVCRLEVDGTTKGILHDALWDPDFAMLLLETIGRRRRLKGEAGEMVAAPTRAFRSVLNADGGRMEPSILGTEQSNTSIVYKDKCILKLFRRLEVGVNPELEIGRFLTEEGTFEHTPKVLGAIEYQQRNSQPMTVAVLHAFVPNLGDAWSYTLDAVGRYFERILARRVDLASVPMPEKPLLDLIEEDAPPPVGELIGTYLEAARLLGQRTAELHLALARETDNQGFVPEEFNEFYQRGRYHALVGLLDQTFQLLRRRLPRLQEDVGRVATQVLALEGDIRKRFEFMRERRLTALRIRCHGDYHLGQVLYTGKDFVIIDFEGEPARPLGERRLKRSPFRDVCGMVRSFHYAAHSVLFGPTAVVRPEDVAVLEPWARFWYVWVSAAFLKAYVSTAAQGAFLPRQREELKGLLDTFLLEKAIYELGYELNNRPSWVRVPLQGVLHLLQDSAR